MPVRICPQILDGLSVNAPIISIPVAPNVAIKSGDPLYRINIDDVIYVTNVPMETDSYITAIAKNSRMHPNSVECYNLLIGIEYSELEKYPYIILEQFTYDELAKINIGTNLSKQCKAINKASIKVLNEYSVKNLNDFGARNLR